MADDTSDDTVSYRKEVLNFLWSLRIKYTPFIEAYNNMVIRRGYPVDDSDPSTWKYYLNMQGKYHPIDTMMTVISLDTQTVIDFTTDNLLAHPRTAAAYVAGSDYVTELVARYPDQVDLIQSIIYPAGDYTDIASADNFTILTYGEGILENAEEGPIINDISTYLDYMSNRWYMDFLCYIPAWPWIFWGCLMHRLSECIFASRIRLIKTPFVHSWHIWQYLTSSGIQDYRGSLGRSQQMFLYRNMEYILAHRGSMNNLVVLADNILSQVGVGLFRRTIYQDTNQNAENFRLSPNLVAVRIPTKYTGAVTTLPVSSVGAIIKRLVEAGYDNDSSQEYINSVEQTLGQTSVNIIPTKVMEIRPIARDRQFTTFFNRFVIDTLIVLAAQGKYDVNISIVDPFNGVEFPTNVPDAILLYMYCTIRSFGEAATNIPSSYFCTTAFKLEIPEPDPMFTVDGLTIPLRSLVDADTFMDIPAYPIGVANAEQFSTDLEGLFTSSLTQLLMWRNCGSAYGRKAFAYLKQLCVYNEEIDIPFGNGYTNFDDFISRRYEVVRAKVFDDYDQTVNPGELYGNLADTIMSAIIPITSFFSKYGNFASSYKELRSLFMDLCSYNVVFLDTDAADNRQMFVTGITVDPRDIVTSAQLEAEMAPHVHHSLTNDPGITPVVHQKEISFWTESDLGLSARRKNTTTVEITDSYGMDTTTLKGVGVTLQTQVSGNTVSNRRVGFTITEVQPG